MAHLVRFEAHADQRYRIVQSAHGFLLSFTLRGEAGQLRDPQEWLYRTQEVAERGFAFMVMMNAWWDALASGRPADDLADKCDIAAGEHARAIERLNDKPVVGPALNAFRRPRESDDDGKGASTLGAARNHGDADSRVRSFQPWLRGSAD